MKATKKPVKFKSLSIPDPLFDEMKKYVQRSSRYRSMAEFLRASIREKLESDKMRGDMSIIPPEVWFKKHGKTLESRAKKYTLEDLDNRIKELEKEIKSIKKK